MTDRRRLPDTRKSVTNKMTIRHADGEGGPLTELDIYATVGFYEDGTPGELFLKAGKMGETISGLLDAVAVCISLGLQHGVPIHAYLQKLRGTKFQPSGTTKLGLVSSPLDAIARWLETKFPDETPK